MKSDQQKRDTEMTYTIKTDAGKHKNETHVINQDGKTVKKFAGVDRDILAKSWVEKRAR